MRVLSQTVLVGLIPIFSDPDPETGERTLTGHLDGWHVNVPADQIVPALTPYQVTPEPRGICIYANAESRTGYLRFDDEAQAWGVLVPLGLLPEAEGIERGFIPDPLADDGEGV